MKRESKKGIFAKIAAMFRELGQGHGTIVGFKGESHEASTIQRDESLPDYSQSGTKFSRSGFPQDDDAGRMSPGEWEEYVSRNVLAVQKGILASRGGRDNKPVRAPASAESGEKRDIKPNAKSAPIPQYPAVSAKPQPKQHRQDAQERQGNKSTSVPNGAKSGEVRTDIKPNAEPAPIPQSPAVSAKSSERYYPAGHNVWGVWRDSGIANVGTSGARAERDYSALKASGVNWPIDDNDWRIRAAIENQEKRDMAAFLKANAGEGGKQGNPKRRAGQKVSTRHPNGPGLH